MKTILALDASSTTVGWVLWDGSRAIAHSTIKLQGDLVQRICLAETAIAALLRRHAPDAVALEGATTRFANHVIAQQRVCGVILLSIARAGLLSLEIAPSLAKKTLTGKGNADKALMQQHAAGWLVGADEHAADALGVAMAAWPMVRVQVEEMAA
jgi:Holliday junction resolvasome RuvABC endonuclease subunit